jgi:signal transduction histidine kinase
MASRVPEAGSHGPASSAVGGLGDEALLGLAMEAGRSLDPSEVVRTILAQSARMAPADRATLSSWHAGALTIEASVNAGGRGDLTWPGRSYDLSWVTRQPLIREALDTQAVVIGGQMDVPGAAPEFRDALNKVRHTATIPLLHDGTLNGLLVLSRFGDPGFAEEDRGRLATLGAIAGLALRNARAHQEARDAAQRLDAADRTRSELLDIAVHELRSPLTVIQGYAALLLNGDLGHLEPAALKAIRVIASKAREGQEIATALLTVARLERDALAVERAPFTVAPLLEWVAERARPRAELTGIRLAVTCSPDLRAEGDATLTGRILDNLVNNAITYSDPQGDVQVSAQLSGEMVTVRVGDRGIGIAEADRERIFERFARGPGAERAAGTGLGLYLSRECARRMGGDLVLESSAPGEGSTFLLSLPAAQPSAPAGGVETDLGAA